jgi:hypothetical protein
MLGMGMVCRRVSSTKKTETFASQLAVHYLHSFSSVLSLEYSSLEVRAPLPMICVAYRYQEISMLRHDGGPSILFFWNLAAGPPTSETRGSLVTSERDPIVREPSWKEVQTRPTEALQTKRSNNWKTESQPHTSYFVRRTRVILRNPRAFK